MNCFERNIKQHSMPMMSVCYRQPLKIKDESNFENDQFHYVVKTFLLALSTFLAFLMKTERTEGNGSERID